MTPRRHHRSGANQLRNFIAHSNPKKQAWKIQEKVRLLKSLQLRHHVHLIFFSRKNRLTAFAGNARSMTALKPLYREATPSSLISSLRTSRNPLGYFPSGAEKQGQQQKLRQENQGHPHGVHPSNHQGRDGPPGQDISPGWTSYDCFNYCATTQTNLILLSLKGLVTRKYLEKQIRKGDFKDVDGLPAFSYILMANTHISHAHHTFVTLQLLLDSLLVK